MIWLKKNNDILKKINYVTDLIFNQYLLGKNKNFLLLGNYCEIKTGKLNAEEAIDNGNYPFFTCGKNVLRINKFDFDCEAIIISGNGEISCKYYEGKFNAYQRTYVLSPIKYFYLFQKACEFSIENLKLNSQGSVIKFITKKMLEEIKIPINESMDIVEDKMKILYKLLLKIENHIAKLKAIKNLLLSKYF